MKKQLKLTLLSLLILGSSAAQATDDDDLSGAALIKKGEQVAIASDCQACHTKPEGGAPFAGGYGISSPMGMIYATNITPSNVEGIGSYSEEQFARAVRDGIRADGTHLYPAMPYTSYTRLSDADIKALYAYFMHAVKPVDQKNTLTDLPFPFNLRFSMAAWNLLFLKEGRFAPDAGKSEQWNRGAYLVNGPGHCDTCHTPRNLLMAEDNGQPLAGGMVGSWYAPNITSDPISGIGGWSQQQLVQYLKTGQVAGKNQAAGGMAEAIENSLQYFSDEDLSAIAVYLKSTAPIRDRHDSQAADSYGKPANVEPQLRGLHPATANNTLTDGAALFSGNCASCHQPDGSGSKNQAYPSLFNNTATGSGNPANLISAILFGVERRVGGEHVLMPNFGPQSYVNPLNDQQIAAISNYVLQQYGNPAVKVSATDVAVLRQGGPIPLLARLQPYMAPAIGLAVLALLILVWLVGRKRR
ncbi:Alcohol dehydrogenase cytochrome c subunit precursor [Serratia quinivorans]|uniref:cytochrome c n=1 Tax=Serratia quinivorans TaxID=137545 RepID=UPI000D96CD93|nr:cytochrome c [Serratia quinivorans]SPZ60587.1 Alcohol dehydrogenase cytochrome c subunit precursor [Serratia quinivorans]VEI67532.1 Alcohol dehydrogenase cytochrome c subunit precursor [Serratia quinivorans]